MAFERPTTKEEMYSILKDIFYYYRIKKAEFHQETLRPIMLERLECNLLDDKELMKKAEDLVAYDQLLEMDKLHVKLNEELENYKHKYRESTRVYNLTVEKIIENYNKSALNIQEQALKRGVGLTSVVTAQLAELESKKNDYLSDAERQCEEEKGFYSSKIDEITERMSHLGDEFTEAFERQKTQKFIELKDEQDKLEREIFKYNNVINEKEQRSINSVAQSNATLQLKYMEISSENFTKDQLIEMGYYVDVIDCVCAYYDTLEPYTAWREIANDEKVVIYLEEYYTQVVFMYQSRIEGM